MKSNFRKLCVCLTLILVLANIIFITFTPKFSVIKILNLAFLASNHYPNNTNFHFKLSTFCPIYTIHHETFDHTGTTCVPHIPRDKACNYTAKVFAPIPWAAKCKDQDEPPFKLCTISETKSLDGAFMKLAVKCNLFLCDRKKKMYIEVINPSNGNMIKYDLPKEPSDKTIEKLVYYQAKASREKDINFLFLNCYSGSNGKLISQMLTFLPALPAEKDKTSSNKVNVNVVLLDSISRAHFFRSLPNTVKYLRDKQDDSNYNAHIFDFELFQAVHGHTHESEHALFSGILFPDNFTSEKKEKSPVKLEVLFGLFKNAGYQTMFLDDLCWKGVWGIVTKLKAHGWKDMMEKTKRSNIDTRGERI